MNKDMVVKVEEVMPYCPVSLLGQYESRLLIAPDGVGSTKLGITHATVKPGTSSGRPELHPPPYDEAFYILHGRARVDFPDANESFEIEPDSVIFIPAGTRHCIANIGEEDLVFLGLLPVFPTEEGVNPVIDGRRRDWGTSFRKVSEQT